MVANYTEVVTSDIDIDNLCLVDDLSSDSKNAILECVKKAIGNTPGGDNKYQLPGLPQGDEYFRHPCEVLAPWATAASFTL